MRTDFLFSNEKHRGQARSIRLSAYVPVLILFAVSIAAALSIALGFGGAVGMSIHAFMGFALSAFALLKLLDLSEFADAFARFDVLARRWRSYAYLHPFMELGLGLAYFAYIAPVQVYFATVVLFALNAISVIAAMDRGPEPDQPRAGISLRVITAVESAVMIVMALVLLWL